MSLARLIFYSGVLGGWAALAGWFLSEPVFRLLGGTFWQNVLQVTLVTCIVGAAIGVGLSIAAGLSNSQWKQLARRALPGLLFGALGGAVGGFVGSMLFGLLGLPKAIGWMVMGAAIGLADGVSERSWPKIRNGLIGGSLGGLLGGFLFEPIAMLAESETGMASRAIAFTVLGVSIGCLIGTVQVAFKQAWLTVLDGYRTGRQLILSRPETVLGRAEFCPLPFLGPHDQELDLEHLAIVQRSDNRFGLRDNGSQLGTLLNGIRIDSEVPLQDGDIIRLGANFVRFNEKKSNKAVQEVDDLSGGPTGQATPPPPKAPAPPEPRTVTEQPVKPVSSQASTEVAPTRLAPPPPPSPSRSIPASGPDKSPPERRSPGPAPPAAPQLPKPPPPPPPPPKK